MTEITNAHKIVLLSLIELIRDQGLQHPGELEGLNAYQALSEALAQADACGLCPADIGLDGFDPDILLQKPLQVA